AEAKARQESEEKARTQDRTRQVAEQPKRDEVVENKAQATLNAMRAAQQKETAKTTTATAEVVVKRKSTNKPIKPVNVKQVETAEQRKAREAE
ncbi:translation initiation factor IF-2, partial [Acinetobacter baumannii]